ncbi:MAG: ParA family protein [Clostridia bacterium]|nr:ParA family protein [Clostridia bacterium]
MAKVIAFTNQKGGVGKTTSAINIASALGIMGKKVLLIDSDPQGNTSSGVGVRKSQLSSTTYDVLIGRCSASAAIQHTEFKNLDIMPSTMDLAGAEFELADIEKRETRLKSALEEVADKYDSRRIDCPPSLGMLTVNALVASDGAIIPMQCEYFSLEGLSQMMMTIKQVKRLYNSKLSLTGILVTMYNGRLNLSLQVIEEIKKYYANKLFKTTITRNVRLSEAPSFGQPIQYYDKHAKGAEAYNDVAKELLERI